MTILSIPVRKAGRSINVDTDLLLPNNGEAEFEQFNALLAQAPKLRYVLTYGLTQSLNDAHAADTKKTNATPDTIMAQVEKKLAAIYDGTIRVKGSGASGLTPIMREAMKLARAWWKSKGEAAQNATIGAVRATSDLFTDLDDKTMVEKILLNYAKRDAIQTHAAEIVEVNAKQVDSGEVDLTELGFEVEEIDEDDSDDESDE